MRRRLASAVAVIAAFSTAAPASAGVLPYGTGDAGGFRNILPPGQNGFANAVGVGRYEANGTRSPHSDDQLAMYHSLSTAGPVIPSSALGRYFKDAIFGVRAGEVASTESPEPGVTIERDSAYGVPHIYGETRPALEFGIGWATAEDRLFEIDVLRHAGAGNLASFAGGANAGTDASSWANEPYTQDDLLAQAAYVRSLPGGAQVIADGENFVDGINAYIAMATANPVNQALYLPGEYAAVGRPQGPAPFTLTDVISTASLIGGQLGQGGGQQLARALLYEDLARRFGPERLPAAGAPAVVAVRRAARRRRAAKRWRAARRPDRSGFGVLTRLVAVDDPLAPTTIARTRFPYQTLPAQRQLARASIALPDPGSVRYVNTVAAGTGAARDVSADSVPAVLDPVAARAAATIRAGARGGIAGGFPRSASNALLVGAAHSASGRPIAVIGPQVAYWSPEILMEEDIHGPGIDARGASFPGTNIYVELGRGRDYAWSATSEGQNIIDTFAVPLCSPDGSPPSADSEYYRLGARCVKMEALTETESWSPTLADTTPAGSVTLRTLRTAYGLVIARATVGGRPVVYTNLRATYLHELDSAIGFAGFNDSARMTTPKAFMDNAYRISYTFNWFFVNGRHIAYFASGANPVRARGTDPLFPSWSSYPWRGYVPAETLTPAVATERQEPPRAHPRVVDQAYLTSWNNQPAHGYDFVAGDTAYTSVYRSQLLDRGIAGALRASGGKMTLAQLVGAMSNAGTEDLRGVEVLPYALRVIGTPHTPALAALVRELRAWVASGAHRINRASPGASGTYEQADAIRVMDAWWPLLVKADLEPALGPALLAELERNYSVDNPPHTRQGSAWDTGFYGTVQEDLRAVLGERSLARRPGRVMCGLGSRARCRAALTASLLAAAATPAARVYPQSGDCAAGDAMCFDAIHYTSIGLFAQPAQEWVNRPTFQQVVEVGAPSGG